MSALEGVSKSPPPQWKASLINEDEEEHVLEIRLAGDPVGKVLLGTKVKLASEVQSSEKQNWVPLKVQLQGNKDETEVYVNVNLLAKQLLCSTEKVRAAPDKVLSEGIAKLRTEEMTRKDTAKKEKELEPEIKKLESEAIKRKAAEMQAKRSEILEGADIPAALSESLSKMIQTQGKTMIEEAQQAKEGYKLFTHKFNEVSTKILVNKLGEFHVFLPNKEGEGSFKIVYKSLKFNSAETLALALAKEPITEEERKKLKSKDEMLLKFRGIEGVAQVHMIAYLPAEGGKVQQAILQEFYPDDIEIQIAASRLTGSQNYERQLDQAIGMSRGLRNVHALDIVHRDIKPGNVMERRGSGEGQTVLIDFDGATPEGETWKMGTLQYCAPEALEALNAKDDSVKKAVGKPSDVWSMGVTLSELFFPSLEIPWQAMQTPVEGLKLIKDHLPAFHQSLEKCVKEDPAKKPIADLIKEMVAPHPAKRPTMADVVRRLEAAKEINKREETQGKIKEALEGIHANPHIKAALPEYLKELDLMVKEDPKKAAAAGLIKLILGEKAQIDAELTKFYKESPNISETLKALESIRENLG